MDKKRIAYVSAELNRIDPDPDLDWPIFNSACQDLPLLVDLVHWDDAAVDWAKYELVVIRSPWNYSERRNDFVAWAQRVEAQTKLLNPAAIVKANTDKTYLADLSEQISVIPTLFVPPGQVDQDDIVELILQAGALAIKPNIGAGASLASRVTSTQEALAAISRIHQAGFIAMIQPYLTEVDKNGEVAIVVLGGEISHAVQKVPALTVGGHGDAQAETEVTQEMRDFVQKISSLIPNWNELLYARVDVVPTEQGLFLMELELTEPTLFFEQNPAAAKRLAQIVLDRLTSR